MKGDEFSILLKQLKVGDEGAWLDIHEHIGILLSSWARKQKIELDWVASAEGIEDSRSVQKAVYSRLKEELLSGLLELDTYEDYKAAVSRYSQDSLKEGFARFNSLIADKNDNAWKKVNARLFIYAAKWLSGKKIDTESSSDIYQESVITFCEKVTGKKLLFETSRDLKSYYFRVLELKTMESNRKSVVHNQRFTKHETDFLFRPVPEEGFERDDKYFYIEKIMINTISKEEYHILKRYYFHGDKLKSIAKSLQISDLNCRQKKHQALRKIASVYRDIEAQKQNHKLHLTSQLDSNG